MLTTYRYGPFWIATTVIFLLAATGNFASWLTYALHGLSSEWEYNFQEVSYGAITIYRSFPILILNEKSFTSSFTNVFLTSNSFVGLGPLLIWAIAKWWLEANIRFMEHICIFGYSLFVYIPASVRPSLLSYQSYFLSIMHLYYTLRGLFYGGKEECATIAQDIRSIFSSF